MPVHRKKQRRWHPIFGDHVRVFRRRSRGLRRRGKKGQRTGQCPLFNVAIEIESVSDLSNCQVKKAKMSVLVSYKLLGKNLPIHEGVFTLFKPDAASGTRQMTYSFCLPAMTV